MKKLFSHWNPTAVGGPQLEFPGDVAVAPRVCGLGVWRGLWLVAQGWPCPHTVTPSEPQCLSFVAAGTEGTSRAHGADGAARPHGECWEWGVMELGRGNWG